LFSCKKEATLNFSEFSLLKENAALVEINMPKADGSSEASKAINSTLNAFASKTLNPDYSEANPENIQYHIQIFNDAYTTFKSQVSTTSSEALPIWEAIIDGEVIYKNEKQVCITMSANKNTGGAHSSMVLKFFNFDIKTGKELTTTDLISDVTAFTTLAETYFDKDRLEDDNDNPFSIDDPVFELPEQIGFNDEGVIIVLYDESMPTAEYSEFVVPYEAANVYLK
jgi:hypothetical protein